MTSRRIARKSFYIGLGNTSKKIFSLLSNLILARLLLPEDFGVISIAYIFWSFFVLFIESSTSLFILYKGIEDKRYVETTLSISIINGVFVTVLLSSFSPIIANFFNTEELQALLYLYAFNLLLSSVYFVYGAILLRQNKHRNFAFNILIASFVRVCSTVIAAFGGAKYWSFAIGDSVYWWMLLGLTISQAKISLSLKLHWNVVREVFNYCIGVIGTSLGFYANSNLDNFAVGKFVGKTSLGYYNLAYQLSMGITTVINPIMNQVATPNFADISSSDEQKAVLSSVMREIFLVLAPVYCCILLGFNQSIISWVFGENWLPVLDVFPWLVLASFARVLNSPMKAMLAAKGMPGVNALVNLIIAPFAILGFIVGAQLGGAVGVSIAAFLILGLLWFLLWWTIGCYKLNWPLKEVLFPSLRPISLILFSLTTSLVVPSDYKAPFFISLYIFLLWIFIKDRFFFYSHQVVRIFKKLLKFTHM